jgi:DNA polymerase-3 subunit alpha
MEEWIGYMIYGCPEKGIEGALNRGFDEATLLKIKADWIKFGDYCFNLAHSACYAVLSVYTAYLKCYYPAEFMAALLTISEGKKDKNGKPKSVHYMQECEAMGLQILPPDIKESNDSWTPVVTQNGKAIRYGLASIAGVTSETVDDIHKIGLGFVETFDDFLYRLDAYRQVSGKTLINKTRMIALIQAGAFDSMDPNRNLLHRNYMRYRGEEYETIPAKTSKRDVLKFEKQLLGSSVSVKSRWEQIEDGKENITMTGHVVKFDILTSKKGKRYCKMLFETPEDEINVMIFDWLLKEHENKLTPGFKIQLKGKKSGNDFMANKIVHVQQVEQTWDVAL